MSTKRLPSRDELVICFAHLAYPKGDAYARRQTGIQWYEVRSVDELRASAARPHVIVASGFWRNELLDEAPNLCFVQSISAGTDQYDKERFREKGVRLASAKGVNARAVAEHAMSLNIELGILIQGGEYPRKVEQLFDGYVARGVFERLHVRS